ncbi:MAG: hypothetical protein JNM97_17690 [Rhodoferax sp.]|nr:hypothetical protein [Rhodoferax sp.]
MSPPGSGPGAHQAAIRAIRASKASICCAGNCLVAAGPGTSPDAATRIVTQRLTALRGGAAFAIENRSGAAPDGSTLLMAVTAVWGVNPHVHKRVGPEPIRGLAPVVQIDFSPAFMVLQDAVPARTLPEFIAHAKVQPGRLNDGSVGPGSIHHLLAERFNAQAGVQMVHVPYKAGTQITAGLMGGEIQVTFGGYGTVLPAIQAGKARMVGVATEQRDPTPVSTPEQLARVVRNDYEQFGRIIKDIGITPE